jgi:hypothetical protein
MTRLKAQTKELRIRPPADEWLAAYFKYERPSCDDDGASSATAQIPVSSLPEFEP